MPRLASFFVHIKYCDSNCTFIFSKGCETRFSSPPYPDAPPPPKKKEKKEKTAKMIIFVCLPTTGDEWALDKGLWPTVAPGETDPADDAAAKSAWRSCRACWFPCSKDPFSGESCWRSWRISWSSCICCSWLVWGEGRSSWLCVCQSKYTGVFFLFYFIFPFHGFWPEVKQQEVIFISA